MTDVALPKTGYGFKEKADACRVVSRIVAAVRGLDASIGESIGQTSSKLEGFPSLLTEQELAAAVKRSPAGTGRDALMIRCRSAAELEALRHERLTMAEEFREAVSGSSRRSTFLAAFLAAGAGVGTVLAAIAFLWSVLSSTLNRLESVTSTLSDGFANRTTEISLLGQTSTQNSRLIASLATNDGRLEKLVYENAKQIAVLGGVVGNVKDTVDDIKVIVDRIDRRQR